MADFAKIAGMIATVLKWILLVGPVFPFLYYLVAIYCARRFFSAPVTRNEDFTPPVSILKPVRGLDPDAYENFASFCRQDYPDCEILFCVAQDRDPAIPVIERLKANFPQRQIRLLIGAERIGANAKVNKLARLAREARHEILVISDSDIVVAPDYLRAVVAPFRDARVGGVTCMYLGFAQGWGAELEALGATADFFAAVMVARQVRGVDFGLGATIATTKRHLAEIGGFESFADYLADDYELGHRIAARGHRVELIRHTVHTHYPPVNFSEFFAHQLRWTLALRSSDPLGYAGMIFTQGLPWALAAAAAALVHSRANAAYALLGAAYLVLYLALRLALAWEVGVRGFKDPIVRRNWWHIPHRDLLWFIVWLVAMFKRRVIWRGTEFVLRRGRLVPVHPSL